MTEAQLRSVMKYHLKNFNDEGVAINDQTVHDQVLSTTDGFGAANSAAIYKAAIRWTLWNADHKDPTWPANWLSLSVKDLATKLMATA